MTPDKYRRLKPLFEQALDTPPERRSEFILKIRMADEELGRELESLVHSHSESGDAETRSMDMPLVRFQNFYSPEAPSFAPNELLLDRFRIVRFVGRGGMGEVYEAEDLQLGRIALKTIRTDLAGKLRALARFRQEVQLARKVTSTSVCRIHELFPLPPGDPSGAAAFLTMEFLEGDTLCDRIAREGALPLPEAESIALQLCAAVQAIHDAGVIHRDIKSRNVMLVPRNGATQVVVMDLGLARDSASVPDAEAGLTVPGAIMGTPEYMAPEQFAGAQATPATDVYALGVLLYEIATGKRPFQASTPMAAAVLRAKRTPSASSMREKLPRRWDGVISRCLEYEPELRYRSAIEVADALRGPRRHRVRRIAGYAAAAVLLVAAVAGIARSPLLNRPARSTSASIGPAKTMVVLPFENLGGDAANQAFCDGLQETMTSMLSQAEKLRNSILVVPSSEVRRNQVKTIADSRRVFNANLALTGSVQKSAGSLQVTLNLTDVQTLRQQDSRILLVKPNEMAGLPQRLASQIDSLLGAGSLRAAQTAPGETTRDPEAYRLYIQGLGALQSRKLDEAKDDFQGAVTKDPGFTAATAKLAEIFVWKYVDSRDTKWIAQADSVLSRIADNGQTPEVLLAQAMIWQATGENGKAEPLLRQFLQAEPNNVEVWDMLADTLKAAGKNAEAEETYQTAVRLRPGYWPAYNKMGAFYLSRQEYAKAEQAFLAAIRISPENPSPHANLGAMYFNLSRWKEAERELGEFVRLNPYAPGYSNLGTVLFFEGRYDEAARQFEKATKLQSANHIWWGNLGDARWQIAGQRDRAREAFQEAYLQASKRLLLNPGDVQAHKSIALYLAKLGRSKEARSEIEAAIKQAPEDVNVRFYAARVYADIGDLKSADTAANYCLDHGYDREEVEREPDLKPLHLAGDAKRGR
jgi:serine/threonine protein kinase/tetratricopeptide (TPR) repeat protein